MFSKLLWAKKEIRILILGLDNAGKTTLLYRLKIGEVVTTIPTIGFNVESVTYKNLNFNVWDLGGQTSIRPYWRCYYANTAAVVFVIDTTDIDRLETASGELRAMLDEEELRDAALLVFANKQDQPGAKGAGDISEALKLGELKDRNWSIMACSAIDGRGINEGMDWLVVSWPCLLERSEVKLRHYTANGGRCIIASPRLHLRVSVYFARRRGVTTEPCVCVCSRSGGDLKAFSIRVVLSEIKQGTILGET